MKQEALMISVYKMYMHAKKIEDKQSFIKLNQPYKSFSSFVFYKNMPFLTIENYLQDW